MLPPQLARHAALIVLTLAALGGLIEIIPWRTDIPAQLTRATVIWPPSIDLAKVYLERSPGKLTPCPKSGREKHQCDSPGWAYVGTKTDMQVQGKRTRCIWAHPIKGATTHIRYPKLEASTSKPNARKARFALDDRAITKDGAPVKITWSLDQEGGEHVHPNQQGWSEITLPADAGALQLSISAADVGRRHFCFELR